MEVLSNDQWDEVGGGLTLILATMLRFLEQLNSAVTGFIDGARDAWNGQPYNPDGNPQ